MEFDEMKKIWDAQNNQPLYVIDEKALHNRIRSKMTAILFLASITDWSLIFIYLVVGGILIGLNLSQRVANVFEYIEAVWMFGIVGYMVVSHIRRIKASRQFDRSIQGDLDHAISLAGYQMRISQLVSWNLLPLGAIMIFSGWEAGKLFKVSVIVVLSSVLAVYVNSTGYRANKRRKRELQVLKEKLEGGS
jgi:hypothetical protein